jgi:hypothetical protein
MKNILSHEGVAERQFAIIIDVNDCKNSFKEVSNFTAKKVYHFSKNN